MINKYKQIDGNTNIIKPQIGTDEFIIIDTNKTQKIDIIKAPNNKVENANTAQQITDLGPISTAALLAKISDNIEQDMQSKQEYIPNLNKASTPLAGFNDPRNTLSEYSKTRENAILFIDSAVNNYLSTNNIKITQPNLYKNLATELGIQNNSNRFDSIKTAIADEILKTLYNKQKLNKFDPKAIKQEFYKAKWFSRVQNYDKQNAMAILDHLTHNIDPASKTLIDGHKDAIIKNIINLIKTPTPGHDATKKDANYTITAKAIGQKIIDFIEQTFSRILGKPLKLNEQEKAGVIKLISEIIMNKQQNTR